MEKYQVGDVIQLKKKHPCGSTNWEIIRYGIDVKIKCVKCERIIMIARVDLLKDIVKKVSSI